MSLAFPTVDIEMPVKRAASIFCAVADLYIVDFGGGEPERTRREQERKAERRRLAARYVRHLVASAEVNEAAARRVIAALFDSRDADGNECACSCHPRLSSSHGDGFDCRCTWNGDRRAAEAARWRDWWDSPEAAELNAAYQRVGQPQVATGPGRAGNRASASVAGALAALIALARMSSESVIPRDRAVSARMSRSAGRRRTATRAVR